MTSLKHNQTLDQRFSVMCLIKDAARADSINSKNNTSVQEIATEAQKKQKELDQKYQREENRSEKKESGGILNTIGNIAQQIVIGLLSDHNIQISPQEAQKVFNIVFGGGFHHLPPEQIAHIIQKIQVLAKQMPGGVRDILSLISFAQQLTQKDNIPSAYAGLIVSQAAAMVPVFAQLARRLGLGGLSPQEAAVLDATLRAASIRSAHGMMASATAALAESFPHLAAGNTPLASLYRSIVRGDHYVPELNMHWSGLDIFTWLNLMTMSGVPRSVAWSTIYAKDSLVPYAFKYNITDWSRRIQATAEVQPILRMMFTRGALYTGLHPLMAQQISNMASHILLNQPLETYETPAAMAQQVTQLIVKQAPQLAPMSGMIQSALVNSFHFADHFIRSDPRFRIYAGGLPSFVSMHRSDILQSLAKTNAASDVMAQTMQQSSLFGAFSPMQRFVLGLQSMRPGETWLKPLLYAVGAVPLQDLSNIQHNVHIPWMSYLPWNQQQDFYEAAQSYLQSFGGSGNPSANTSTSGTQNVYGAMPFGHIP